MIQLVMEENRLIASEQLLSPAVYLDHWALRAVSTSGDLTVRFTHALAMAHGTLVISWANIAEFAGPDQEAARRAEIFIDGLLPNLFFLSCDPFDVMNLEQAWIAGRSRVSPHADQDLVRVVIGLKPRGVHPVTCLGMLTAVSSQHLDPMERLKRTFVERMGSLREEYLEDGAFRRLVDRSPKDPQDPRGTSVVLREVVAGLLRDRRTTFTENDAMDFYHTIVPVAYCDYVLLDGRWRDQIDRLRRRLEGVTKGFPIAVALSGKDAVARLVDMLEHRSNV
jgi:hypothetical protein